MAGKYICLEYDAFLKHFLPVPLPQKCETLRRFAGLFDSIKNIKPESDMCGAFVGDYILLTKFIAPSDLIYLVGSECELEIQNHLSWI